MFSFDLRLQAGWLASGAADISDGPADATASLTRRDQGAGADSILDDGTPPFSRPATAFEK